MKPLVKYRGGKAREIPLFIKYVPEQFDTYYEPFLGGGAVFFHLEPQKSVINDINTRLMTFYIDVKEKYSLVREQLDELQSIYEANQSEYQYQKKLHPDEHIKNKNEVLYYQLRDMFNHKTKSLYLDSVLYFFINKTAYSGMIRYNSQGEFNVPFGRYQHLNTQLLTQSHHELLERASLFSCDYTEIFGIASKGDFMFLDPPYDCIFNDYGNLESKNGFDEFEQKRLA